LRRPGRFSISASGEVVHEVTHWLARVRSALRDGGGDDLRAEASIRSNLHEWTCRNYFARFSRSSRSGRPSRERLTRPVRMRL
jgi:hypothetical protein